MVEQDGAQLGLVLEQSVSVFLGTLANALSVGANTVNGPLPVSVSASPARSTSEMSVVNWPAACAVSTMFGVSWA